MKAVIFDLDGTLLNTSEDLGAALNHTLRVNNMPEVDKSIYSPAISNGSKALIEVGFGSKLVNFDIDTLRQQLLDYYEQHIAIHSYCFDGISELLTTFKSSGIKVGIMTNKPTFLTLPLLKQIPELRDISVVVCGDTLDEAKPSPKPLLFAAEQLNVEPHECYYVGDAARDIEAAKAAKMYSVAALWGFIPSIEDAHNWQADLNLTNPRALTEHI